MFERYTVAETDAFTIEIEMFEGMPFFHLNLRKWSKDIYKDGRLLFEEICFKLGELGHPAVFVAVPVDDKKLIKFEKMFGFEEIEVMYGVQLMGRNSYGD